MLHQAECSWYLEMLAHHAEVLGLTTGSSEQALGAFMIISCASDR